jgi:hypothetical protein
MEVREHFYADDPTVGPADGRTTLRDVEYFFLGNGRIQAAVQIAPSGDATPVGLLLMDPDRLGPKRAALSFDPDKGLAATAVTLGSREGTCGPRPGSVRAAWLRTSVDPRVRVVWTAGPYRVEEIFFCPDMTSPRLLRRVTVTRTASGPAAVRLTTGLKRKTVEAGVRFRGRSSAPVVFEYRIARRGGAPFAGLRLGPGEGPGAPVPAVDYWKATADCRFHDPLLDRFFAASKSQLRAAVSASGRLDGSIWQYNLEWVRDQAFNAMALAMSGQPEIARTVLARLLRDFVSDEGATMDSSRQRPLEESEVDQNGVLLFALESYLDWTGDASLVRDNWDRIRKVAAFPLRPEFRHAPSGLIVNRREFWERHDIYGIQPGMELAHQLFVAKGLLSAGRLAGRLGRTREADEWTEASLDLRRALLKDPRFALVEAGTFIKRRGLDGRVQRDIRPDPASTLPRQAPLFGPGRHWLDPDTSSVLPIAWELVDPAGRLAAKTLASMERLWNQRWSGGGYGRYNVTSEPDSPGPWPFASLFVARAALEAGDAGKTRRVLDWLGRLGGAGAGSWFEFYGPRPVPPYPQVGIIPWTWAELIFLFVHHMLGVRPGENSLSLRPKLIPGVERMEADLALRGGRLRLEVRRTRRGEEPGFRCGPRRIPYHRYGLGIDLPPRLDRITVRAVVP